MKKIIAISAFVLLVASAVACGALRSRPEVSVPIGSQTARAEQGSEPVAVADDGVEADAVEADGVVASGTVRSNQSAWLSWKSPGTVGSVNSTAGDPVASGQELASLTPASLPQNVILAQAELVSAKKSLDGLLNSRLQQAQALKAVEEAQKALEDLLNPRMTQAQAKEAITSAQKAVDQADLRQYTLTTPPAQSAIDQAHANMLLAENKLNHTRKQLERMQNQLKKLKLIPASFRSTFRRYLQRGVENLEVQLNRDQMAYDRQVDQYNNLLGPADPTDLAVAQADLERAQAQLADAQREYQRLKDGPSQAEIAVAEAHLADAQREWERLKDGPDPDDITAAQARVAAAEAALSQVHITAPFDGVITQVSSKPGDQVSTGTLAFRLDDLSRLLVDVQVSEVDINQVRAGQTAVLAFDGSPAKTYHGQVVEVAPVGIETEGAVYFTATVEMTDADPAVRPGMTAEVEIIVSLEEG